MQSQDRDRFESLIEKLYGGYNMPLSKARTEAYWDGLAKMPLSQFARCIEHCLGEGGPERIPTVSGIWAIRKKLTERAELPKAPKRTPDRLEYFANRLLWWHQRARGGLGSVDGKPSAELSACLKLRRELVVEFTSYIREGDDLATPEAFVIAWIAGLKSIGPLAPGESDALQRLGHIDAARDPFPASMIETDAAA